MLPQFQNELPFYSKPQYLSICTSCMNTGGQFPYTLAHQLILYTLLWNAVSFYITFQADAKRRHHAQRSTMFQMLKEHPNNRKQNRSLLPSYSLTLQQQQKLNHSTSGKRTGLLMP